MPRDGSMRNYLTFTQGSWKYLVMDFNCRPFHDQAIEIQETTWNSITWPSKSRQPCLSTINVTTPRQKVHLLISMTFNLLYILICTYLFPRRPFHLTKSQHLSISIYDLILSPPHFCLDVQLTVCRFNSMTHH